MKPVIIIQNDPIVPGGTIIDYFESKNLPFQVVKNYDLEELPAPYDTSAVISLGSTMATYTTDLPEHIKRLHSYIARLVRENTKFLGICFSAQMLAKVVGADVLANETKELGCYQMSLTNDGRNDRLFSRFESKFDVFQWHGDTFKIAFGNKLLVTGETCTNQAFRLNNAVGVQFHPEINVEIATNWAERHEADLNALGKSVSTIVAEVKANADNLKQLNFALLDNFLKD